MKIKPGKEMKEALSVFKDLIIPFTEKQLKLVYLKLAKKTHPDLFPDDPDATKKMKLVTKSFDYLKIYASKDSDNGNGNGNEIELEFETFYKDPMKVYKNCDFCKGLKQVEVLDYIGTFACPDCEQRYDWDGIKDKYRSEGYFNDPCRACKGTGQFQQRNTKKIVTCRVCKGHGSFYKKCPSCYGFGTKDVHEKRVKVCPQCKGKGQLEHDVFNPVLKPNAVAK